MIQPKPPEMPKYPDELRDIYLPITSGESLKDLITKLPEGGDPSNFVFDIEISSGSGCSCCGPDATASVTLRGPALISEEDRVRLTAEFEAAYKKYQRDFSKYRKKMDEYNEYKIREAATKRAAKAEERRSNKRLLENPASSVGESK